jgi:hypothetical protein
MLDVLTGDAHGVEAEPGVEALGLGGGEGADEDLIGPLLAHVRDGPRDQGGRNAALPEARKGEQIALRL